MNDKLTELVCYSVIIANSGKLDAIRASETQN